MLRTVKVNKSSPEVSRSISGIKTLSKAPAGLPTNVDMPVTSLTVSTSAVDTLLKPESFHDGEIESWVSRYSLSADITQPHVFSKLLRSAQAKLEGQSPAEIKVLKKASRLLGMYDKNRDYVYKMISAVKSA